MRIIHQTSGDTEMKTPFLAMVFGLAAVLWMGVTSSAMASTASEREYKRGYADCTAGRYDQNQHGASYKRGCRAAEDKMPKKDGTGAAAPATAPTPSAAVPRSDGTACLRAVAKTTRNKNVVQLGGETSEANNTVIVGVGPQRAKWRCLVKNGKVGDVMSLTDEGKL